MRQPPRTDNNYNEYVKDFYRKIEDYDWNEVTDNFKGLESFLHRGREKIVVKLINKYKIGNKCLDVGCGTGLILRHLPPGSTGVDINPRHLALALHYVPRANIKINDAENLDFDDNTFSSIICTEVLEHLVLPEHALQEMYRVLKPGGLLIGSTPRHTFIWKLRFLSSTHFHNEPFHNEYTEKQITALLNNKFRILLLKKGFFRSNFFFVLKKPNQSY